MRTKKQMVNIDASWVVTRMANAHHWRDIAVMFFPNFSMYARVFVILANSPVATSIKRSC